jgi:DNA polymerase I
MDIGLLPTNIFLGAGPILGTGPMPSDIMIIGLSPESRDQYTLRPFSGQAGVILTRLFEYYTDWRRPGLYVTQIIKHIIPEGHTPKVKEINAYLPFLRQEILAANPRIIITLGAPAARLFDKKLKLSDEHGIARLSSLPDTWAGTHVPWFHPLNALSSPSVFESMANDASRLPDEIKRADLPPAQTDYQLWNEEQLVHELMSRWGDIGFDTETTSPKRGGVFMTDEADMVGYSVSWAPHQGVYVAASDFGPGMRTVLESPLWNKICHNTKFEYKILQKLGVTLVNYEDTRLAAYVVGEPRTGLKVLTKQNLGVTPITYDEVTKGKQMSELPPEDIYEYAAMDADHTLSLWPMYQRRMDQSNVRRIYREFEIPLIPVFAGMEQRGIGVDVAQCFLVQKELTDAIERARNETEQVFAERGYTISAASNDQVADALAAMDAPLRKRTEKTRRFVVDAPCLEAIRVWDPELLDPLLTFRKVSKLLNYVTSFITLRASDGRLHTSFNQCGHYEEDGKSVTAGPSTGRISSSGPNLQNVPNHRATLAGVHWGKKLRDCIVAKPGFTLLSADLGQEEPRIVAVLAQDDTLLRGFAEGSDIYRPGTMALYPHTLSDEDDRIWKPKYEDWERFVGKTFFLAWYYGAGAGRLKDMDPGLSKSDIAKGLALLSKAHPAREAYLSGILAQLKEHGYIETLFGRRRDIPKIWSANAKDREDALREAANGKVQGTAADILKIALARIDKGLSRMQSKLVSTIHDEVIIEAADNEVDSVVGIVQRAFEGLLPDVPLILETYTGTRWSERNRLS